MTMHLDDTNVHAKPRGETPPTSTIREILADMHVQCGRPIRVLELGNAGTEPWAATLTGSTPMEPVDERSSVTPDVVIIHPDLKLTAMVQALYAVRPDLTMDSILCGPGGDQLQQWPAAQIMLEQFIQDYRVEGRFWIARPSGLAFLKCLADYAEVADLVARVEYELAEQLDARGQLGAFAHRQHRSANELSIEAVEWALRIILDREPINGTEISELQRTHTGMASLRRDLMQSPEFKKRNKDIQWAGFSPDEPGMQIELDSSASDRDTLLAHIQSSWEQLGKDEPHWSVLTAEQYKRKNIIESENSFYRTGVPNVDSLWNTLIRNNVNPASLKTCVEYGCGLGRVTRWLAERVDTVHGYDISRAHLDAAERYLKAEHIDNVVLHHVTDLMAIDRMERADLVYSVIVLQHNPPPIIALIVRALLETLNPGGVAFFQLPTYQRGYRFSCRDYLAKRGGLLGMEMHVLPQAEVFSIAAQSNTRVLEVFEDNWTGITNGGRSNTFVIQKA